MENTSKQADTPVKSLGKISKKVLIPVIGLLLFAAAAGVAYFYTKPMMADAAVKKAVDYVNANMLADGVTATYKDIKVQDGLYAFKLTVEGQDYDAYVTKSGKLFFPSVIDISAVETTKNQPVEIVKNDKPDVKLFIMSYCPYGLQAQKMYLPVYNLLKDKVNMGIYFVSYAMHGKIELDENLRQYCIEKEQQDKFAAYLECFTADTYYATCKTEDCTADYKTCLAKAKVDAAKVNACVSATDSQFKVTENYNNKETWLNGRYPKFDLNADLNTQYAVQGSPTIIINDTDTKTLLTARNPEALKQLICSSFNNPPAECQTVLSSDAPIPGFGAGTDASASSGGGCGN